MPHPSRLASSVLIVVASGILGLIGAAPAWGAAQRTFVASYGSDVGPPPCSLALPCRSFNVAIGNTLPGGEVVILDTAGYGPMTINKSIKIIGPTGVYGGISALGAGINPATGIVINAGDTDVITLRGLDISGVPQGSAPYPDAGIDIQNAGVVHIEKSSIGNFTQDTSDCIRVITARPIEVYVNDSFLRECRNGFFVLGSGADDASRINLVIDNTRIEHGINTTATGTNAIRLNGAFLATVRNSVLAWAGDGIKASNGTAGVNARFYVIQSDITRMGNAALETLGSASLLVNVSNSVINLNGAGLLHGHGAARFVTSVITNNQESIVDCGAGSANVKSLGYGGGTGSNTIQDNPDGTPGTSCLPGTYITPTQFTGN